MALFIVSGAPGWAADVRETKSQETDTRSQFGETDFAHPKGVLFDLVASNDTDGFRRNIVRAGAMVQHNSIYDFIAVGASTNNFSQGDWSKRVNSAVAMIRKVDRKTGEGLFARGAVVVNGEKPVLLGEAVWNKRFSASTGAEFIASRDAIESRAALDQGTLANYFAVSLDHAVTDRLTVIGMPTYRRFSDGNEQPGLRGFIIYGIAPEHGLSLSLKARAYESTQDGGGAYFSPDRYERAEIGLRLRRSFGDWRVFATADVGRERIDRDIEKPTNQLALTATRAYSNGTSVGIQLVRSHATSDSTFDVSAAGHYVWRMARVYLAIPM
jgi:hypothetical protein